MKQKGYSNAEICAVFQINKTTVKRLFFMYKSYGKDVLLHPVNSRSHSTEDKLEIVQKHLNGSSYGELCVIYGIMNSGTIAGWVKKYSEEGYNGLTGKQGRPCKYMKKYEPKIEPIGPSPTESKKDLLKENKKLKKENEYLRAKIAYEKKLDALVREREARETMKKH